MSQGGILTSNSGGGGGDVTSVTGVHGVTAFPTTGAVVVSGVNATTSTVGVASFNPAMFAVSGVGAVSVTVLPGANGGTGVANTGKTITLTPFVSGQVLTSDVSGNAAYAALPASIITIAGDTGIITGNSLTIYAANSASNAGSTVMFNNTGTTSTLLLSNGDNTMLGTHCGDSSLISGQTGNTGVGYFCLASLTVGGGDGYNTAMGRSSGIGLLTGLHNTLYGASSGGNYGAAETNNICIGYSVLGTPNENNTTRLGDPTTVTQCFVGGINGITAVGSPVGVNNTTGQLSDLGFGTSGQYFGSNGAGVSPTWKAFGSTAITFAGDTGTPFATSSVTVSGGTTGLTFNAATPNLNLGGDLIVANGGTGKTTFTAYSVITAGTTATGAFQNVVGVGTSGQVLTSAGAGALPTWTSLVSPAGPWVDQTTASVTMTTNTGYTSDDGASLVTFTLPTTAAIGDYVEINGKGSGLWIIAQAAGQQIFVSPTQTTLGVGGSLASVNQYDCVRLRCITANTTFVVVSQQSNGLTVV